MSQYQHFIFLDYPIKSIPRFGWNKPPHAKLYEIINRNRLLYEEYLKKFLKHKEKFIRINRHEDTTFASCPSWINGWLPGLDSVALYGFLCENNPVRYYEIGSGNSTKFAKQAIKDHNLQTEILSIDPSPRTEIDSICDHVVRQPLEDVDLHIFDDLEPGDILFIDNSHRSFMNSDVTVVFLEILPRLKPGVFIEFHDIYLPHDYPQEWITRYYNEQYLLASTLLADGNKYEIIFPSMFIAQDPELSEVMAPLWDDPKMQGVERHGGSFWIKTK
ncbi:TPA: class I SAM-dependent methyltransferase [Bacillus pseudomycoides]|nr:class I SAM-dependent methyltransferase [Bacillus pseudomycoides]